LRSFFDVRTTGAGRGEFFGQRLALLVLALELRTAIDGLGGGTADAEQEAAGQQQCKAN